MGLLLGTKKSWDWILRNTRKILSPGERLWVRLRSACCVEVERGQSWQCAFQALLIWGVGGLWYSKRSPSLFLITCWMTPDGFTSCLKPRLSHLENLLVEVDSLWGWTSYDFFPLGPSPDPPPRESAGHTALDPHEPGSWGDPDEERQILWTDWQWDNRKVVRVQHPVSQVSAGNMSHQIRTNFHLLF